MSRELRWRECSAQAHVNEPVRWLLGSDCPLCAERQDAGEIRADLQQLEWDARVPADVLLDWYRSGAKPRHLADAVDVAAAIERKHGRLTEAQRDELAPAPAGSAAP